MLKAMTRCGFLFLIATWAWAQTDQTGVIRGKVIDENGDPVPGVTIRSSLEDGAYPKTAFSDEAGMFRIGFLKPGKYQLVAEMTGFLTSELKDVRVSAAQVVPVTITMKVGLAEVLVVTSQERLIDTATTEYSSVLDEEITERLPVSRTATDLVEFTPGARAGQVWGGSTDQANNFQFDGVTVNSPGFGGSFLLPNVSWIKEFQVKGLGAGAEYGNFQGGLVNIVTKSGSNTFAGEVEYLYETQSWNSSNLVVAEEGDEPDMAGEFNANVSGAIVKDKFYYFFSAEQQNRVDNIVDVAQSEAQDSVVFIDQQEDRTETKLFGKLTWQASALDTLNLVLGLDDVETDYRGLSSFVAPEATTNQDSPAFFYNFSWERPISDEYFLEVKVTGYDGEDNREPRNGDIPGVQLLNGNRDEFTNARYLRTRDLTSNALSINLDAFFALGETTHHVKLGGTYDQGTWLETRTRNGNFTWRPESAPDLPFDPNDPATWDFISSDWGGDIRLDAETLNAAVFVQDYVTLTDWMELSIGARYAKWEGDATPGDGSGSKFTALSDTGFAPRIGATFDLARNDEWIAKIHWGRYYQNMFSLFFDRVVGVNAFQDVEYWDWIDDALPELGRAYTEAERDQYFEFFDSDSTSQENGPVQDYNHPYVEQLVVGLEKKIGDDWKVGLTYVNRENQNILALVDLNLASNYTLFHDVEVIDYRSGLPVLDQNGSPLVLDSVYISNDDILYEGWAPGMTEAQIDALTYDPEYVLTNADDAFRELDQFQFLVEGSTSKMYLHFSVTHSELVGNFFSVNGYDDPDGIGAGAYVYPNEQINYVGNLQNAPEWEAKLRLTYDLPWDLRTGVFYRYDSGEFYTPAYDIDRRNHDFVASNGEFFSPDHFYSVSGQRIFLESRGNRNYESFSRLDLRLDKAFRFNDTRLLIGLDVFNALNEDAVTLVENEILYDVLESPDGDETMSSQYGRTIRRQNPREVRLLLSYRW